MKPAATLPLFESTPIVAVPSNELRPYQERSIRALRAHVASGKKRILCVAPTGAGKTRILAEVLRGSRLPALFICHRKELIDQTIAQLARVGVTNLGVIRADDERANPNASLQLGSIQTLVRRPRVFAQDRIILIVDECHRALKENSYGTVIAQYPDAIVLGFTATPCRLDGKPLDLFDVIEVVARYEELFKRPDWLVAPILYSSPVKPDLRAVSIVAGEFNEQQAEAVMRESKLEGLIISHWLKYAGRHPGKRQGEWVEGERRRTFCFATGIAHSKEIVERFLAAGVRAAHLDGTTPDDERKETLRRLGTGELELVSNCQVLTEGIDIPSVKCVVHARPTMSLVLWRQTTGRIFRPWNGVTPLILDHARNMDRLSAPHEDMQWSLLGKPKKGAGVAPLRLCPSCFAYVPLAAYVCPYCGADLPRQERELTEDERVELVERQADPLALKLAYYARAEAKARMCGFKPGYAFAIYKGKYGSKPPWEWFEATKALFASDPGWQAMQAARQARKEAEGLAEPEVPRLDVAEPADDFLSWLTGDGG
jgi:DNA repair protein RadD